MNTQGWDSIFCIALDQVNRRLNENAARLPQHIDSTNETGGLKYRLEARMGPWQLRQGAGSLFTLAIPLTLGTFSIPTGTCDIAGVVVGVDVDLRLLPSRVSDASDVGFHFVAPKSTRTGGILCGGDRLSPEMQAFLPFAVAQDLAQHADEITYTLATINPCISGAPFWLRPAESRFAILKDSVSGRMFLAILSSLTHRDVSPLPTTVDVALPVAADTVLAIAPDVLMLNMVLPACKLAYDTQSFAFAPADHAIKQTAAFRLPRVKSGLIWYHPSASKFHAALNGNQLTTRIEGGCSLKMALSMSFWVEAACPFTFNKQRQAIGFAAATSTTHDHNIDCPWPMKYLLPFAAPLAAGITAIVATVIAGDLSSKISSVLSSVARVEDLFQAVSWSGASRPILTDARLEGALVLTGNYQE